MNRTLALALFLTAALARPAAADLIISSSDPSYNASVPALTYDTPLQMNYSNNTRGVTFTVEQESTLTSVIAQIEFESGEAESLTAQLLKVGTPENDKYGTPSYQYTLLGTSSMINVPGTGTNSFSEQTLSFSGEELDPGNTYMIVFEGSLPSPGTFIDLEYTSVSSSDFATPYGSIISGIWNYTVASDQTSLVYNEDSTRTPEVTINADLATPEPSTLVLALTGLAVAGLAARMRHPRRAG